MAIRAPDTTIRWVLGGNFHLCLPLDDLWEITVTGPDGSVRDRIWSDISTKVDFSLADQYGTYNVKANSRLGRSQSGSFEWSKPDRLLMESKAIEGGVFLRLTGYGDSPEVDLVAFADTGRFLPMYAQISFYSELPGVSLHPSGITELQIPADRQDVCIFVDRRDGRFDDPDYSCVGQTSRGEPLPGERTTDIALDQALGDPAVVPIGPKYFEADIGRRGAIATLVDRSGREVVGAVVFEGEANPDVFLGFNSVAEVHRVIDDDLVRSFRSACQYAEQTYPRINEPCWSGLLGEVVPLPLIELKFPEPVSPAAIDLRDCLSIDGAGLEIVDEGATGWLLTDGTSRMAVLDNEADAKAALEVARYHNRRCFIGRSNPRADRRTYIAEVWVGGPKGGPVLAGEDCIPYKPGALEIVSLGDQGWRLTDGTSAMLLLDNEADAQEALTMASQHSEHCFIGRDNNRSDRSSYILEYWK